VAREIERAGNRIIPAVENMLGEGRSLRPFDPPEISDAERKLADEKWLDPEASSSSRRTWRPLTGGRLRRWLRRA
jgi:phospholipase D1/2